MRRLLMLAPLAVLLLGPVPAQAWEDTGHRMVNRLAAQAFPAELPAFLRTPETLNRLAELSREPDRSKSSGQPHDADLDPGHFVDLDLDGTVLGGPRLDALPRDRADYEKALQAVKADSWKAGYLPYNLVEGYQQLAKDFGYWRAARVGERTGKTRAERAWFAEDRKLRELLIVRDLGVWGHYVGDGSQPLHVSSHFNGWGDGPNPNNYTRGRIHAPFEGQFVKDNATDAAVRAVMAPYAPCGCAPMASVQRYLLATGAKVEPLYQLWSQGGFESHDPRGTAFVVERLAAGASQLRDFVVDAWRASATIGVGYPATSVKVIEESGVAPYETIRGRS